MKFIARSGLAGGYLAEGRHAEAAAHFRANLDWLDRVARIPTFHSLKADTRRRLADCLEALGDSEGADGQRRLAEAAIRQGPDDPLRNLTRGQFLTQKNRHAEAIVAFEGALALTPEANRLGRIECLCHLVLACDNSGRPADSLRRAEEAIALGAEGVFARLAHKMAGLALGNLGRPEEAEGQWRRALALTEVQGDRGEVGQILGSLADLLRKRGKLSEANEAALRASAVDPKAERQALAVQIAIFQEWGRFDDALEMLRRSGEKPKSIIPALERRIGAARNMERARIQCEAGRPDAARTAIDEAIAVLRDDARLGLKCRAILARVEAGRGFAAESRTLAAAVEARLPEFDADPTTRRGILYDLGMAAWARGDHEAGEDCWTRYLGLGPDPVHRPTGLYFRGECRRHRGDTTDAQADFRAAVAAGIDSHHARLARLRLGDFWES